VNSLVIPYLEGLGIRRIFVESELKASQAERTNQKLMQMIARYWTKTKTFKWIKVYKFFEQQINNRVHSVTKFKLNDINEKNQFQVWTNLYQNLLDKEKENPVFKVGDSVTFSEIRSPFAKGYLPGWKNKVYRIAQVHNTSPVVYTLEDRPEHGGGLVVG